MVCYRNYLHADEYNQDWQYEEAAERARKRTLHSHRGLRRLLSPFLEGTLIWLVLILTGIAVGITGAWLDILVAWLSDIKTGRCKYGFYYNQVACCSGLDGNINLLPGVL